MEIVHKPVLLQETLALLSPHKGDFAVDCTVNGGGHATALLTELGPSGSLLALDWDDTLASAAAELFKNDKRVVVVNSNYAALPDVLAAKNLGPADILLADLGFSSVQLESGRGFSFQKDEPLQMTYHSGERSAAEMVNSLPEKELADLIYLYGGERRSRRIAKAIVESRRASRILTTGQLTAVVAKALGASYEKGRINPATRTFQALRIAVNREMENVETLLGALPNVMKKGGRVAIITFHSLEDALVKNAFRNLAKAGRVELLTKKPIGPSRSEVIGNARARSAKVRAIRFL